MTEADFQRQVVDLARILGWRTYHTYDSRRSAPGFPDLVLAHPTRGVLFRELKTDTGRLTVPQNEWLAVLTDSGADAAVWRPADMPLIQQQLGGRQ